jgi:hypothetical protein
MNPAPKLFSPDARNVGGRKIIVNHLYKHLNSLENATSALKLKAVPSPCIIINLILSEENAITNV